MPATHQVLADVTTDLWRPVISAAVETRISPSSMPVSSGDHRCPRWYLTAADPPCCYRRVSSSCARDPRDQLDDHVLRKNEAVVGTQSEQVHQALPGKLSGLIYWHV